MGEFKLWCCIESDNCYFGVPVSPHCTIDDLRVQIYNKKKGFFIGWGDADLNLKKVDVNISDAEGNISDGRYHPNADDRVLLPREVIGNVWPREPPADRLHIFISIPGAKNKDSDAASSYEGYRECFVQMEPWGFDQDTLIRNMVCVIESLEPYGCPDKLEEYQQGLRRRRAIHPDFKEQLISELGNDNFEEFYQLEGFDDSICCKFEMQHMSMIAGTYNDNLLGVGWKEFDAHTIFFAPFARYCKNSQPELSPQFGFGQCQWPVKLVVYWRGKDGCIQDARYDPKSDFFAHLGGMVRLIVEVKSASNEDDRKRMLSQGASLVRLVNKMLIENRGKPDFILMAVYFNVDTTFDKYLLYQIAERNEEVKQKVYCFKERFSNSKRDRVRLAHQLYNLASIAKEETHKFHKVERPLSNISLSIKDLPSYSSMKPSTPTKRTGGTIGQLAKKSKTKDNHLAADGLEVLDLIGLLGNVFIVRRLEDGKRLVAKVSKNPEEEEILEFLHTRESQSEHIIPLVGAFLSNMGRGILLPLQQSVLPLLRHPGVHRSRFSQFAEDLVRGLSFLHRHCVAHRDIKPDNLVYSDKFQLQIIDFDSAVQLADPDQLLDEDVGTEGYKSPDTQDSYGRPRLHSPIKADSWSCGLVISRFLSCSSCSDKEAHLHQNLERFARRLMDEDPWSRPSLCEWFKPVKPPNKKRDDVQVEDKVDAPRKRQRVEEYDESYSQTKCMLSTENHRCDRIP